MFDYKNASEDELKAEFQRIAKICNSDSFGTKKELKHLPDALLDGEQVKALLSGMFDGNTWLIALTDLRIIFLDKGMLYGLKQATIDLEQISSVMGKSGMIMGEIWITATNGEFKIESVAKSSVDPFTKMVQEQVQALKNKGVGGAVNTPDSDPLAKLEKLSELLEKGILTPEEFAEQKAKILGS